MSAFTNAVAAVHESPEGARARCKKPRIARKKNVCPRSDFISGAGKRDSLHSPKRLAAQEDFIRLGLADTAISTVAPNRYLVLTDEFALFGLLTRRAEQ